MGKALEDRTSTFADNVSLPIHNWYRYSAGYSAKWVNELLQQQKNLGRKKVIDPFVGSGTTILEAENCDMQSIGIESHPFVFRIAQAKLSWDVDVDELRKEATKLIAKAKRTETDKLKYPEIIERCYPKESLIKLDALRRAVSKLDLESNTGRLLWITLASILRECSPAGTASWQYLLPNKTKARITEPYFAFERKMNLIQKDIETKLMFNVKKKATLLNEDCRGDISIKSNWGDLVVTSPPYANNYDYADATRLEMSFFKEIDGWKDLQEVVRPYLVRSCTQHVASMAKDTDSVLNEPLLYPIADEIWDVCKRLEVERLNHGGKKTYHTMIASYFLDLAKVWVNLRRVLKDGALVCFVVGDSAPYGIYAPVDEWLGKLAVASGFDSYSFEKTRDRNTKWKNRKHTVLLKEGRLWVNG